MKIVFIWKKHATFIKYIIEFNTFLRSPIEKYPFYMLIETSGSNMNHDEEKLTNFLESSMEQGIVLDGTVTNEPTKMRVRSRHRITATRMSTANRIFPEHLEAPWTDRRQSHQRWLLLQVRHFASVGQLLRHSAGRAGPGWSAGNQGHRLWARGRFEPPSERVVWKVYAWDLPTVGTVCVRVHVQAEGKCQRWARDRVPQDQVPEVLEAAGIVGVDAADEADDGPQRNFEPLQSASSGLELRIVQMRFFFVWK